MRRIFFRILLLSAALAYMATLSVNVAGEWFSKPATIGNLSRALRWNPGNPLLWSKYGRYWLYASEGSESNKAADAFLRAAAVNPLDPANWDGLTSAYLQTGESRKAEAALRAWLVAVPHSPEAAWRLGNFLLFQDRATEALPHLKAAGTEDQRLRLPLFDLAWKVLADPEAILRELVPADPEAREEYLQFLIERRKLTEAREVWQEVRSRHSKRALSLGYSYVETLTAAAMGREAAKLWEELLADTGRTRTKPPGELLTNGDFEAGLPNVGLDWRLAAGSGYQIDLDESVVQNGSHSLRITFDGTSNPEFRGVWQVVPVEPNHDYRFLAHLKTENITSDNGLRLEVSNVPGITADAFILLTENAVETNPWKLQQLDFRTGSKTHLVQVTVLRLRSSKLNNLIQGKVWIDNLSLRTRP